MVPSTKYVQRLVDPKLDWMLERFTAVMVEGPRASGKTTTLRRRAQSVVRFDVPGQAAAFRADPDSALAAHKEPVLIDEWQLVPEILGAVKRAVDANPDPGRFLLTGSAHSRRSQNAYPGTGRVQRLNMLPMTIREIEGRVSSKDFFARILENDLTEPTIAQGLVDYMSMAMTSGFPEPALNLAADARPEWLRDYISDLLTRDAVELDPSPTRKRDTARLSSYFKAFALSTAGVSDHRSVYEKTGIRRETAEAYEETLLELMVVDLVPSWLTNRLKRLVERPKRFVVDAALTASESGLDLTGIIADGDLLGRVLETFAVAQLRAEATVSEYQLVLHHLRTKAGRQEIDLLIELADTRIIGIEVKAQSAPTAHDARHLAWLRDQLGDRFAAGLVLHTGPALYPLGGSITAAPIASIWS